MTETVSDQFWPTTALVIPVLALAFVVEVRTTIARWDKGFPWWLRSVQGILWVSVLALFPIVEYIAFEDLANNKLTSSAWTLAAQIAITQSIITLIVTPALEVFTQSNARIIGAAISRLAGTPWQWKLTKTHFRLRKIERQLDDEREHLEKSLLEATIVERRIRDEGPAGKDDYDRDLGQAESTKTDINNQLTALADKRRLLIDAWAELDSAKKFVAKGMEMVRAIVEKSIDENHETDQSSSPTPDETAP